MDLLNVLPNERIGIPDFEAGTGELQLDENIRLGRVMMLPTGRSTTGAAATSARVLGGFDFDTIAFGVDDTVTLNRGSAIMPLLRNNVQQFGLLQGDEGPASFILDYSSAAIGTQAVYVRAVYTVATFQNRVFWNPSGAPAREFVDSVGTRKVSSWEIVTQDSAAPPPGSGEYVKIWEVDIAAGPVVNALVDFRHFYYEGSANPLDGPYEQEWGDGALDRSDDRATNGINDDHLWKQLVRRQLDDIIGIGGHWKAPSNSLNTTARFVTVDQPGGPGAEGTYATVNAAITALNAADGGTIVLYEGTYDITTVFDDVTAQINILAAEEGVILSNNVTANDYMLTYATGSQGSWILGVTMDEGVNSSEQMIEALVGDIRIEQCVINGECTLEPTTSTSGSGLIVVDQCAIIGAATGANTDCVVRIAGGTGTVKLKDTRIGSGATATRGDTIFCNGLTGTLSIEDCRIEGSGVVANGASLLTMGVATGRLVARGTVFVCSPYGGAGKEAINIIQSLSSLFESCRFEIEGGIGDNLNAPIISYTDTTAKRGQLVFDKCLFNFGDKLVDGALFSSAPIYLAGYDSKFNHCRFIAITLSNAGTTGNNVDNFIEVTPPANGRASFNVCTFEDITSENSGLIDMSLVGQSASASGTGRFHFRGCDINGTDKTFRGVDVGKMLAFGALTGGLTNLIITDNHFEGGTWSQIVNITDAGCLVCRNILLFDANVTPNLDGALIQVSGQQVENARGYAVISQNFLFHEALQSSNAAIAVDVFHRVSVDGNVVMNAGAALTQSIHVQNVDNATSHSNNADEGIVYTTVGVGLPGTLSSHNVMS